jgi:Peptidase family M28
MPSKRALARAGFCLLLGYFVLFGASAAWPQLDFRVLPRDAIEKHLKEFSRDNAKRESIVKDWFAQEGCKDSNLTEQSLGRELPPNVICVVPGESGRTIVVGAHTDHVTSFGEGVVDNWTSAALLPSFLHSLSGKARHHTFVYVGFSAEEKGMLGSIYYAQHLTPEQRGNIAAMINMDSLGLGPTEVWASHADIGLLQALRAVAATMHLPLEAVDVEEVGSTDSESFVPYGIPRITLHSVTQATLPILHSPNDRLSAIRMDDYYDSYRLIAAYLVYLDDGLKPPPAAKPDQTAH